MTDFSEIALSAPLQRALTEIDYVTMTPVQAASLPAVLAGRDVVAQAATGSGKTAVFALVSQVTAKEQIGSVTGIVGAVGGLGGFVPPPRDGTDPRRDLPLPAMQEALGFARVELRAFSGEELHLAQG